LAIKAIGFVTLPEEQMIAQLRQELTRRVGAERFDLWFGSSVTFHAQGGKLIVQAADQFKLDRLLKLRSHLQAAYEELAGAGACVEFAVAAVNIEQLAAEERNASNRLRLVTAENLDDSKLPANGPRDGNGASSSALRNGAESSEATGGSLRYRRKFADLSSFVVGDGNRIAYLAASRVVQRFGAANPVFLHGPTGCGKTHLLEGVWSAIRRTAPSRRVLYLTAEQFTASFLEALPGRKGLPSFRSKYRGVDLLIVDDVQFFLGKKATLVELFHTVEALLRDGRQLVLAADRAPAELAGLGSELIARLSGGLTCGIESPDAATRRGILERLARGLTAPLGEDLLSQLASSLPADARQLAGAVHRLEAASQALGQPISLALAHAVLGDIFNAARRSIRLRDIEAAVCDVCGVSPSDLQSNRKTKAVSHPRMLAMWLARKYTRAPYSEIGEYFGRRSHATVISAQAKVDAWMAEKAELHLPQGDYTAEELVKRVESQLRAG
jgi:chromosomal replication initiator protein